MATYKKKASKPKNKEERKELEAQQSTTAGVFTALDQSASRTEAWVARNQKYILGIIGVIAVGVLGYLAYSQFVQKPKETEATNELLYPQRYFEQALNNPAAKDSLFNLALNGADGKYGFLDIISEYSGTKAANLASYSAGMAYLNMGKYREAIDHLEDFSSDDAMLGPLATGGIGDAFMQLGQAGEALSYYEKAMRSKNDYTTPRFLYKAGITALELKNKDKALQYFQRIKNEFAASDEARSIDAFIGMAKSGN